MQGELFLASDASEQFQTRKKLFEKLKTPTQ